MLFRSRDKVLFIDARNYYTVVDRTLNEWSEWQLKNLNAIVWLYRGNRVRYDMLVDHYEHILSMLAVELQDDMIIETAKFMLDETYWSILLEENRTKFYEICNKVVNELPNLHWYDLVKSQENIGKLQRLKSMTEQFEGYSTQALKSSVHKSILFHSSSSDKYPTPKYNRNGSWVSQKKAMAVMIKNDCYRVVSTLNELINTLSEYFWITEKFGVDGKYKDIPGLCKIATRAEIEDKGWSLTPGAYVGVAPTKDDGVDFAARMAEIHQELLTLQAESNTLMETISKNMKEMGL